jgi:hypothetical protein
VVVFEGRWVKDAQWATRKKAKGAAKGAKTKKI